MTELYEDGTVHNPDVENAEARQTLDCPDCGEKYIAKNAKLHPYCDACAAKRDQDA